jgi:hypothetical protein
MSPSNQGISLPPQSNGGKGLHQSPSDFQQRQQSPHLVPAGSMIVHQPKNPPQPTLSNILFNFSFR